MVFRARTVCKEEGLCAVVYTDQRTLKIPSVPSPVLVHYVLIVQEVQAE